MKKLLVAFTCGTIFGLGLAVAQMTDPAKILNFLNVLGHWDATLVVVMGAALLTALPAFHRPARAWAQPWLGGVFSRPPGRPINLRLVVGAAVFGLGWGIGGFCPGPGIEALVSGQGGVWIFVASMLAGMAVYEWWAVVGAPRHAATQATPGKPLFEPGEEEDG